ncbi:ankyrin repeat-containing domain protein [Trichoderma sp. SZMC 28011]
MATDTAVNLSTEQNQGFQLGFNNGTVENNFHNNVEIQQGPTRKAREIGIMRRLYKSPYKDRKDRNPDPARGTCEWFIAHKLFLEWQESKRSTTLWVSADPGCGKSVLVKHLVDSVLPRASRTTCYFFFKDDFEDQKNVSSALCCILHQLFEQKRVLLSEAILDDFEMYQEEITGSFERLWTTLLKVADDRNAGEIVCLLDAIDECEDSGRAQLARALQTLYRTGRSFNLKFLLTSRPYVNIRHGFRPPDVPELAVIHLSGESDVEMEKISEEINTFIHARVQIVGEQLKLRDDEQDLLLRKLMQVPNRTYLWVYLTLDLIEQDLDLDTDRIVRTTSHLPNTVEEAYERILSRSRDFEKAKKLLHIVVAAARPLTLNEMNLALTLRNDHRAYSDLDLKSEERFREDVRDLCGLFIAVINSRIYLLHQTAKEFLVQDNPANISNPIHVIMKWKHSLRPQESHRVLAEICIWHLHFAEFEDKFLFPLYNDNHVFLDYSAKHWTTHVRESHIEVKNSINQSILELCDGTSNRCLTWLRIYWKSTNTDFPQNFTALMITSYFGLPTVMKLLLKLKSPDLNSRDSMYRRSALSWAAGNGHHVAVKLLIRGIRGHWKGIKLPFNVGAQVDSMDRHNLTPLSYAVLNGHVATAELLLKAGASVNERDSIGGTPLSYAVCNGHESMANLLLKKGTNVDSKDDISAELLLSAARKGHEGIVKLLLDGGRVDPNSKDKNGNTPLYLAVENNHKPIIKLLLGKSEDTATVTEEVLKAVAENPEHGTRMMTLLLDQLGDQITITEKVLKGAAENPKHGNTLMTLLLDRLGDQIPITEDVLKAAAGTPGNDDRVIESLLKRIGDHITITDEFFKTVATCSRSSLLFYLFKRKSLSEIDLTKWLRISELFWTVTTRDIATVSRLINEGVDINMRNYRGETPLWIAAAHGQERVVQMLVQRKDVDINAISISGRSPLFWPSSRGYVGVVAILMKAGADPRLMDKDGNTAVTVAIQNGHEKLVKVLEQRR